MERDGPVVKAAHYGGTPGEIISGTAHQDLAAIEAQCTGQTIDNTYLYVPSRFTPDTKFQLVPLNVERGLPSYEQTARALKARVTLTFIPEFWTIEPLIYRSSRKLKVVHTPIGPANTLAALELIRQLQPELVVAGIESAQALDIALDSWADVPRPRAWQIIRATDDDRLFTPKTGTAMHDFHILPGLSIGCQCAHLAAEPEPTFHPSSDFLWEVLGDGLFVITSAVDAPMPLRRYAVPARAVDTMCPCGERTLALA